MTDGTGPASPSEDIGARRAWRGATLADGVLTPEIAAHCQMGVAVIVAACAAGRPLAGRGFAARIDEAGTVRLLLRRTGHHALLAAWQAGAQIAATFTEPTRHRSIQLKGRAARVSPANVADGMALEVQCRAFRAGLMAIKYTKELTDHYAVTDPDDVVAVEFTPVEAFVQTPGPGAGSALRP